MELDEISGEFVFKTRIDIDDKGNFVEMRELNTQEMSSLRLTDKEDDAQKNILQMEKLFTSCLIDHSFTEYGEKASNAKVYAELKKSGSIFLEILTTWMQSIPFSGRLKKEK